MSASSAVVVSVPTGCGAVVSVPTGCGAVVSVPPAGEVIRAVVPPAVGDVGKSCHQMCCAT